MPAGQRPRPDTGVGHRGALGVFGRPGKEVRGVARLLRRSPAGRRSASDRALEFRGIPPTRQPGLPTELPESRHVPHTGEVSGRQGLAEHRPRRRSLGSSSAWPAAKNLSRHCEARAAVMPNSRDTDSRSSPRRRRSTVARLRRAEHRPFRSRSAAAPVALRRRRTLIVLPHLDTPPDREYLGRQRNFTGYHFWARWYCVSTVGILADNPRPGMTTFHSTPPAVYRILPTLAITDFPARPSPTSPLAGC